MVQHPEVLWAQRSSDSSEEKNIIFVTINLPDIKEFSLVYDLTPTTISFKAKAGEVEKEFAFELEFYSEVVPKESTRSLNTRSLSLVIRKKDKQSGYWPRLTKQKVKNAFLKTDFSKWVDEDEQNGEITAEDPDLDMGGMGGMGGGMGGGMDFEKMMAQMGGMGGMGGSSSGSTGGETGELSDDDDSDHDVPPPLEDAEPVK